MKDKLLLIIAVALIIISIGTIAYPSISNTVNQTQYNSLISKFNSRREHIQSVDNTQSDNHSEEEDNLDTYEYYTGKVFEKDLIKLLSDSQKYNEALKKHQNMDVDFSIPALDLNNYSLWDNMYGYIKADSIGVSLPIYLGSTDENMTYGAVHLYGTSLPIGGESTNCVLAGHTGFIGRNFFDNIKYLETGEKVTIVNYFESLDYEVESKAVISMTDTDSLYIRPHEDRLILMTCANGGSERLIVICRRKP